LPLVGELEEEENRSREEFKILPTSESEGFSEVVMSSVVFFQLLFSSMKLGRV